MSCRDRCFQAVTGLRRRREEARRRHAIEVPPKTGVFNPVAYVTDQDIIEIVEPIIRADNTAEMIAKGRTFVGTLTNPEAGVCTAMLDYLEREFA